MRNTKAFETAVADTLAELAKRGVTARPGTVAASSKKHHRRIQPASHSSALHLTVLGRRPLADSLADQRQR